MFEVRTEKLFDMEMFGSPNNVGETPYGSRRFVQVTGGTFSGKKLKGEILPVGADIALIRRDGIFEPDVNLLLRTDDEALIQVRYHGRYHAPPAVMQKLINREPGVKPGDFYLWNAVFFETGAEKYGWLNGVTAVSTGMPQPIGERGIGMHYAVFQLL